MILGDLLHLTSTYNIGAAIANIGNIGHIPTKHRCNTGRSHATSQHVLCCSLMDQGIGPFDGTQQRGRDFVTVVLIIHIANSIYRYFTRHFACCMATHSIGHYEQGAFFCHHLWVFRDDVGHIIFVVFTLAANIC